MPEFLKRGMPGVRCVQPELENLQRRWDVKSQQGRFHSKCQSISSRAVHRRKVSLRYLLLPSRLWSRSAPRLRASRRRPAWLYPRGRCGWSMDVASDEGVVGAYPTWANWNDPFHGALGWTKQQAKVVFDDSSCYSQELVRVFQLSVDLGNGGDVHWDMRKKHACTHSAITPPLSNWHESHESYIIPPRSTTGQRLINHHRS